MDCKINLIFNRNIQGIIGVNNGLFAGFKDDFLHFKNLTINKIVVMGYNTFISLPGKGDLNPLKNRLNIVITNNHYDILSSKISEEDEILLYKTYDDFYKDITENGIP